MKPHPKLIWTIGHSTRSIEEFTAMLHSFNIDMVVDVRHFPGSRKFPHFNKEALQVSLPQNHIQYRHIEALGGRRKVDKASKNTVWRHPSFRAYADYMETPSFRDAITILEEIAMQQRTAYMCSEAVWWRCHRSMISDYLKVNGWTVMHIMAIAKAEEHPFTAPAKVVNGALTYA
ncbi:MAG: DUF488 domain-containing protein [Ferruginibacter sp.]